MNTFKTIKPEDLAANAFSTIGKDWLLITAEVDGKVNTMTASWGGLGVMWHKNAAFIFIRPQRYTRRFVESSSHLSLWRAGGWVPQGARLSWNRFRPG